MGINKRERLNNMSHKDLIALATNQREFIHEQDHKLVILQTQVHHETSRANANLEDYNHLEGKHKKLKAKYKTLRRKHHQMREAYMDALEALVELHSHE